LVCEVFIKESDPIKTALYEAVNRHIILKLHLKLSSELLQKKTDGNTQHIIREVQRLMNQVIEHGNEGAYSLFNRLSLYEALNTFFEGQKV
jgi:hypothetical protein